MADYIYLEDGSGKLLLETGDAYLLEQAPYIVQLKLSANIAANAATDTTYQLTAPATKSTSDFQAGKISDDTNPITTDLASGKYTELEWSIKTCLGLADNDEIEFRVTNSGTVISTYTVTPKITVGAGAAPELALIPILMRSYRAWRT
jgi:hypothetical protein